MRAYFVTGCESSGTRMMTKLLIQNGCYGQSHDAQMLDHDLRVSRGKDLVMRRSVPHGGDLQPPIKHIIHSLAELGFEVTPIVMVRQWQCQLLSQVKANHVANALEALDSSRQAMEHIMREVAGLHWLLVSYDALVARPNLYGLNVMTNLLPKQDVIMGLDEIRDANAKYYREQKSGDQ